CDPDEVDYPIPGNDDAIRSAALLTRVVADATADGLMSRGGRSVGADGSDKPEVGVTVHEPLAEWEQELMVSSALVPGSPVAGSPVAGSPASITPASITPASTNVGEQEAEPSPAEPMAANNGVSQS
ncbi:MAG: 30S ribosomal protein S2, partial [Pseudonocardiaceae bacterium]